jgi:hypothetical protein
LRVEQHDLDAVGAELTSQVKQRSAYVNRSRKYATDSASPLCSARVELTDGGQRDGEKSSISGLM